MENNTKQTVVDWLINHIENNVHHTIRIPSDYKEQANEMFRNQIEEAFNFGDYNIDLPDGTWEQKYKSPQHYYEETYGKKTGNNQ